MLKSNASGTLFHLSLGAALIAALSYGPVSADEYHYNNIIIGDRAAGLAGSYEGISDDPAGMYYNPAGIVYAASNNLSASMNAYHITVTTYKEALDRKDWTRTSSVLLPSFFGVTQPLGKGAFGFSYAVPDAALEDQDQTFKDITSITQEKSDYTINFNNQDNTLMAGPSYAYPVKDWLSVGVTMYGVSRTQQLIQNEILAIEDTCADYDPTYWNNLYVANTEYGINPMFGVMLTPYEKLSIGVSISKTIPVYSKSVKTLSRTSTLQEVTNPTPGQPIATSCNPAVHTQEESVSTLKRTFPLKFSSGFAYFINPSLLVTGSATVYSPVYAGTSATINGAMGLEYYITQSVAMRLGTYTNFANTPKINPKFIGQVEHVDFVGGSFSITNFTRSSALTLGINPSMGKGQAQVANGVTVEEVSAYSVTLFMSASYSY